MTNGSATDRYPPTVSKLSKVFRRAGLRATVLAMALTPSAALPWGAEGHRLVAELAQARLGPAALAEVQRLLALEPGATMASISTWADEVRTPTTAAWHYLNFARDAQCTYAAERQCIQGSCVVVATERQLQVLADRTATDEARLKALKWVVHLVADNHQPLHAGFADDRGGNSSQVQAYGRGSNLHSVWDSGLVREWPGGLPALRAAMEAEPQAEQAGPALWAEESCRVVADPAFYPEGPTVGPEYGTRWSSKLVRQLAAAGQRLAAALESALGGR